MTLNEAYQILEIDETVTNELVKANYKWLLWFNHPDTKLGNDVVELNKVINAYDLIRKHRDEECGN